MSSFAIAKVYTSKNGAAYTPMIGEWYTLTVEYDVTGTPKNPYTVGFTMADKYQYSTQTDLTPGHKKLHQDFFLALDDEIPWQVEVDPFHLADADDPTKSPIPLQLPFGPVQSGRQFTALRAINWASTLPKFVGVQSLKGKFTPVPPPKAIDFYDPRWLIATQGSFTQFGSGKIDRLAIMVGSPTTDSWQKALKVVCRAEWGGGNDLLASQTVEGAAMYPVFFFDHHNVPNHQLSVICQSVLEVRNQRVDPSLLRAVTWQQLDATQGIDIFKTYTSPEDIIESNNDKITDFVTQTLGANHRNHMTPYDAARKLFKAVLKHCFYFYPQPGGPDKRAGSALVMLDSGLGDCGSFSMFLVALYRNIGFPARTACGAWKGQDAGHCWCEQYFPGHGWMISDGSAGNGECEDGSFAYYFGAVPNLNARYADMRGNTFKIGDLTAQWLQGPYGPFVWGSASATVDAHTAVLEVTESEAMSLVNSGQSNAMASEFQVELNDASFAFQQCPCHRHGGYRSIGQNAIKGLAHAAVQRLG